MEQSADSRLWCGKLGEEITTAEGKQAARSVAVELLATLQAAIGDLNDLRRIVKLLVLVNSGPHFTEAHMVANGASEFFIEVFEEEEPMRSAPWACRRFRLVAALRSRWLWRHLYRQVNANAVPGIREVAADRKIYKVENADGVRRNALAISATAHEIDLWS